MVNKLDEKIRSLAKVIKRNLEQDEKYACTHTGCKRKGVGVRIGWVSPDLGFIPEIGQSLFINGPVNGYDCTNEIGNCGCCHAEVKAVHHAILKNPFEMNRYTMLCQYSPCTNCANAIVNSQMFCVVIYDRLTEHDTRGVDILEKGGVQCFDQRLLEIVQNKRKTSSALVDAKEYFNDTLKRWGVAGRDRSGSARSEG